MDKTENALKRLEKELKAMYTKAYSEIRQELSDITGKINYTPDLTDKQKTALLARKGRLNDMAKQLASKINGAYIEAKGIIDDKMTSVYKMNYNDTAQDLGVKNGFNIIDDAGAKKLLEKNPYALLDIDKKEHLTALFDSVKGDLMTGMLKGESIPRLARRIKNTTERSLRDSVRIARTETTRCQNNAKLDVGEYGKQLGFRIKKKWVSTHDDRTREEHLEMNGAVVDQDDPFEMPDGSKLMFPGDISLGAPPEQTINCFDGNVFAFSNSKIKHSICHEYSGEMLTVKTALGVQFTVTPNHPILTDKGWVAIDTLNIGDNIIIGGLSEKQCLRTNPNKDKAPTKMNALHKLFKVVGTLQRVNRRDANFHGDISHGDVEIVTPKCFLPNRIISFIGQKVKNFFFVLSNLKERFFIINRFSKNLDVACTNRTPSNISVRGESLLFSKRSLRHSVIHRLGTIANTDIVLSQNTIDNLSTYIIGNRKLFNRLPSFIGFDEIVSVDRIITNCHSVYNLQTENNFYFTNNSITHYDGKVNYIGAISHNCRCTMITFIDEDSL